MKQLDENHQSDITETLPVPNGPALAHTALNDLPVNEAQAAEVKGGIVGGSNANIANYPHQLSLRNS